MNRREALWLAAAGLLSRSAGAAPNSASRVSVEGYIWQQYAERQHKKLADVIGEIFSMAREAGFHQVELNQEFLTPELRSRTLHQVRANGLRMPSVYSGGASYNSATAKNTMAQALEMAELCRGFGCHAIVNNPDPKPNDERKSDAELAFQAETYNRLGRELSRRGFQLWIHSHAAGFAENAREWRYNLQHTDPRYVWICFDVDWVYQGGQNPMALLREAGKRVASLHLRNSKNKLWLESLTTGDIDYRQVAAYLNQEEIKPLLVVELAYRKNTVVTRPLEEDLRLSRIYAEKVFGVRR